MIYIRFGIEKTNAGPLNFLTPFFFPLVTQPVYVDPPRIPTTATHSQTTEVAFNTVEIQTITISTRSTAVLTEPEPEIKRVDVMMQTEVEVSTPVAEIETQTNNAKLENRYIQTVKTTLLDMHVQTVETTTCHAEVQTDEVSLL